MFGIGPMELALFLVIVLLVVGPDKLPAFMRTVGRALRQVRNASREFRDAIGLDELMREGDPFRPPPIRPPRSRPVPLEPPRQATQEPGVAGETEPGAAPATGATTPVDEPQPGSEEDRAPGVEGS